MSYQSVGDLASSYQKQRERGAMLGEISAMGIETFDVLLLLHTIAETSRDRRIAGGPKPIDTVMRWRNADNGVAIECTSLNLVGKVDVNFGPYSKRGELRIPEKIILMLLEHPKGVTERKMFTALYKVADTESKILKQYESMRVNLINASKLFGQYRACIPTISRISNKDCSKIKKRAERILSIINATIIDADSVASDMESAHFIKYDPNLHDVPAKREDPDEPEVLPAQEVLAAPEVLPASAR